MTGLPLTPVHRLSLIAGTGFFILSLLFIFLPRTASAQFGCGLPGVGCASNTNFGPLYMYFWACDSSAPNCPAPTSPSSADYAVPGHTLLLHWATGYQTTSGQYGQCSLQGGEFPDYIAVNSPDGTLTVAGGSGVTYNLYCQETYQTGYSYNYSTLSPAYCPNGQTVDSNSRCSGGGANSYAPIGTFDSSASGRFQGWAFDPDVSASSITVHFYGDGPAGGGGTIMGGAFTSVFRSDVNSAYTISGNHGFDWPIPTAWCNGTHSVYAYAIDSSGNGPNPTIGNRTFTCVNNCPTDAPDAPGAPRGRYVPAGTFNITDQGYDFCITNYGAPIFVPTGSAGELSTFITAAQTRLSGSMTYFAHQRY